MKTILEISLRDETRYEIPDEVYELVETALTWRQVRTVKAAVAELPEDLRRQVKVWLVCKPLPAGPIRGYRANVMMVDDFAFREEYQWEPIPPKPDQGWSALGRPIFLDRSKEPGKPSP